MPTSARRVPKYCLHKSSGRARVIWKGKQIYLGAYQSEESWRKYLQLIAEKSPPTKATPLSIAACPPTITEVLHAYREFAAAYYSRDGKPTYEL